MKGPNGESIVVTLGNAKPKDEAAAKAAGGKVVETVVKVSPDSSLIEAFKEITDGRGLWIDHSDEPPAWVESNSDALASLISEQYGIPVGRKKKA